MKFRRNIVVNTIIDDLMKDLIASQTTLKGIIEHNENKASERYTDACRRINENTRLLESAIEEIEELKSEIEELNKPWYKRIVCL
jgi:hypothetical protein